MPMSSSDTTLTELDESKQLTIEWNQNVLDRCWFCGNLLGSDPFLVIDEMIIPDDLMPFCSRECGKNFYGVSSKDEAEEALVVP